MAPAWQEITSRAAQLSLAVMCPACSRSPETAGPDGVREPRPHRCPIQANAVPQASFRSIASPPKLFLDTLKLFLVPTKRIASIAAAHVGWPALARTVPQFC